MKTNEDIEAKIAELKVIGSPSALSKVKELEWVLGLSEGADDEADMLMDSLIGSVQSAPVSLWDQVPAFARDHGLYTFAKKRDQPVGVTAPPAYPGVQASKEDMEAWEKASKEHYDKQTERDLGKKFTWKKLLGVEALKTTTKLKFRRKGEEYDHTGFYTKIPDEAADINTAELIVSRNASGKHRPLLDIDFPAAVIPSSTPGHCHLYIDKELSWKEYQKLLNLFADLGIIEHGYRGASLARGYSALRLPWIKKEQITEELTLDF